MAEEGSLQTSIEANMAEGGSLQTSVEINMAEGESLQTSNDENELGYDYNCSVCIREEEKVYSEAFYYCPQCKKYLCKECVKPFSCYHNQMGRGNVNKWGRPPSGLTLHEECGALQNIPMISSGKQSKHSDNQPYAVEEEIYFNVKIKEDKETCDIWGMCQLPDGSFIVTDNSNMRLKHLDSTYNVIHHCPLSHFPYDVCNTEDGEVAVAMSGKTIQFVFVGDLPTATHSFSTDHDCCSLTYHNKCIYVTSNCGSKVYVYKPSGSLLYTISTDQHNTPLFSCTMHITVSPILGLLFVADRDKGLVTVDLLNGNLFVTFKSRELSWGACAVCVDGAGNVFVKEGRTDRLLQLRQEGGKKVAKIMYQPDDMVSLIRSQFASDVLNKICFDNVNTRLLVTSMEDSDTVTVLQLAQ